MTMNKIAAKSLYAKIAETPAMLDTFNSAYDNLQPLITKFPKAFIPAFVAIAGQSDDFCDKLISKKMLNAFTGSPVKLPGAPIPPRPNVDIAMEMISGLLLIKSEKQGSRFQMILKFLL